MEVVAHTLDHDQIKDLKKEFCKFDPKGVGEISWENFKKVLEENQAFSEEGEGQIYQISDIRSFVILLITSSHHHIITTTHHHTTTPP